MIHIFPLIAEERSYEYADAEIGEDTGKEECICSKCEQPQIVVRHRN